MTTKSITKRQAEARAGDIRSRLESMAENIEAIPVLVAEAYEDGDWEALGYASWEEYVKAEFGTSLLKLERAIRREWVKQLTEKGMSTREIAPVVNTDHSTVVRDLAGADAPQRSSSDDEEPATTEAAPTPEPPSKDAAEAHRIFVRMKRDLQHGLDALHKTAFAKDERSEIAALLREYADAIERKN